MGSFHEYMQEYCRQMQKGDIRKAYAGLMDYIGNLRLHFKGNYPDYFVSGSVYQGYMDMTYFSFVPESLKSRKLKVAIVFVHDSCRFEVWLAGYNKAIQAKYWKAFREHGWDRYRIPDTTRGVDFILEHVLAANPDFRDLDALTVQIERGTLTFIEAIEGFLSQHGL